MAEHLYRTKYYGIFPKKRIVINKSYNHIPLKSKEDKYMHSFVVSDSISRNGKFTNLGNPYTLTWFDSNPEYNIGDIFYIKDILKIENKFYQYKGVNRNQTIITITVEQSGVNLEGDTELNIANEDGSALLPDDY